MSERPGDLRRTLHWKLVLTLGGLCVAAGIGLLFVPDSSVVTMIGGGCISAGIAIVTMLFASTERVVISLVETKLEEHCTAWGDALVVELKDIIDEIVAPMARYSVEHLPPAQVYQHSIDILNRKPPCDVRILMTAREFELKDEGALEWLGRLKEIFADRNKRHKVMRAIAIEARTKAQLEGEMEWVTGFLELEQNKKLSNLYQHLTHDDIPVSVMTLGNRTVFIGFYAHTHFYHVLHIEARHTDEEDTVIDGINRWFDMRYLDEAREGQPRCIIKGGVVKRVELTNFWQLLGEDL